MLETARLDLVEFEMERDLAALHPMFSDPEWARGGYMTPTTSEPESRERLEREFGDNGGRTWVLRIRPEDTAVGVIGVFSDQGSSLRGLSWYLRRDRWGAGLVSEAARTVVDHLLEQPSIRGVEAWIDSRNVRSIAVARHAGLDLVGRLPRTLDGEIAQSVVMGRAAKPTDPTTFAITPGSRSAMSPAPHGCCASCSVSRSASNSTMSSSSASPSGTVRAASRYGAQPARSPPRRSPSTSAYPSILCTTSLAQPVCWIRRRRRTCRGTGVRTRWRCRRDTG
jgi:RimJ/RimL family protein N-acetyltransferase